MQELIEQLSKALQEYSHAGDRDQLTEARRLPPTALKAEAAVIEALMNLEEATRDAGLGAPYVTIGEVGGPALVPDMLARNHAVRERDGEHRSWIEIWNLPAHDWRVWDADGRTHHLVDEEIHRSRVERLYFDPNVSVAISEGADMALTWVGRRDRTHQWIDEIEPRTYDPKWKPPTGAPGALPFEALEFCRLETPLLVFHDFD